MGILVLALHFSLTLATSAVFDPSVVACTLEHPRYAGACVEKVTPEENQTPEQACRAILQCLNDTRCVKSYCQATTLRGGWTLVSATPEQ